MIGEENSYEWNQSSICVVHLISFRKDGTHASKLVTIGSLSLSAKHYSSFREPSRLSGLNLGGRFV